MSAPLNSADREMFRREAGLGVCSDPRREFGRDYRIIALLDALDDAEAHSRTGWTLHSETVERWNQDKLHLGGVVDQMKALLRRACEADALEDCRFDHAGDCQAHGPWGDGEPCPYPLIRQYLAAEPEADR